MHTAVHLTESLADHILHASFALLTAILYCCVGFFVVLFVSLDTVGEVWVRSARLEDEWLL